MNAQFTTSAYLCHLTGELASVAATASDLRDQDEIRVRKACAPSVLEAISKAIGRRGVQFASEHDEREACIAALRCRCVHLTCEGRELRCETVYPA